MRQSRAYLATDPILHQNLQDDIELRRSSVGVHVHQEALSVGMRSVGEGVALYHSAYPAIFEKLVGRAKLRGSMRTPMNRYGHHPH